jgi:hypothetical protein
MPHDLRRTHATPLSDDELILLDVMFDAGASLRLLRRSVFADQWNHPSHNLDDDQLRDTIDRFCEAGILASEPFTWRDEMVSIYWLTPHGGTLWEAERTPVWERYVSGRRSFTRSSGREIVSFCALSENVLSDYWRLGDIDMWRSDVVRVRFWQISRHAIIPWKDFPRIHAAVIYVKDNDSGGVCQDAQVYKGAWGWRLYESRRTWWQSVKELQKFL